MTVETLMESEIWFVVDRVMQWAIAPALGVMWWLNTRTSTLEREIMRILTVLDERNKRRDEDRADMVVALSGLQKTIDKLDHRLEMMDSWVRLYSKNDNGGGG